MIASHATAADRLIRLVRLAVIVALPENQLIFLVLSG